MLVSRKKEYSIEEGDKSVFTAHERYNTKRVMDEVSEELRRLIWNIVDSFTSNREEGDIDYHLQYFELSLEQRDGQVMQRVVHRQEQPAFMEDTVFEIDHPFEGAMILYDEIDRSILMLAEEY